MCKPYHWTTFVCFFILAVWACSEEKESNKTMMSDPEPIIDMEIVDMEIVDMEIVDMLPPDMGSSVESRCPNAQAQTRLLVLYPDRVDSFKQDELGFKVAFDCTFLALNEQGVTAASGMAYDVDGNFYIVQPEGEEGGSIYIYSNNGEYIKKIGPDLNLRDAKGLWLIEDKFVAWNSRNANLYQFDPSTEEITPYTLPAPSEARILNLTDLQYLGEDNEINAPMVLATFTDRPAKLFAHPFSPSFEEDEMGPAHAITTVETPIGMKLLISGQIEGSDDGIMRYRPSQNGRDMPRADGVLVYESDPGYGDGKDLVPIEEGFFVLDSGSASGNPALNSFNIEGFPQEQNALNRPGTPLYLYRLKIFKDF